MIHDERTEFADATALSTGGTGRQLVGDVVDLQVARDMGNGRDLFLVIQVETTFTSGGAATVDFEFSSDAQAAVATDGTATRHASTGSIALATLAAGYTRVIPLPTELPVYERYLGLVANVGTAALTAGKINAFLTVEKVGWKAYPSPSQA